MTEQNKDTLQQQQTALLAQLHRQTVKANAYLLQILQILQKQQKELK